MRRTMAAASWSIIHKSLFSGCLTYGWKRECYKCKRVTIVYTYYLGYDLYELDCSFDGLWGIGLGDIEPVDVALSKKYKTIYESYSNTVNYSYMANHCEHCGAIQGKNYVVDDPHEILGDLENRRLGIYLIENIPCHETGLTLHDVKKAFNDIIL